VGANWAEAVAKAVSERKQINGIAVETLEDLTSNYLVGSLTSAVQAVEAIHDLSNLQSPRWRSL